MENITHKEMKEYLKRFMKLYSKNFRIILFIFKIRLIFKNKDYLNLKKFLNKYNRNLIDKVLWLIIA